MSKASSINRHAARHRVQQKLLQVEMASEMASMRKKPVALGDGNITRLNRHVKGGTTCIYYLRERKVTQ